MLSFGIIAALWSASNGMNAIVRSLNHAYDVEENRSFIIVRLTSIFLTIAMVFTILVALLLPVFGREIGRLASDFVGASDLFLSVWAAIRWGVSPLVLLIVFSALYVIAPNKSCLSGLSCRVRSLRLSAGSLSAHCFHFTSARLRTIAHLREHRGNHRSDDLVLLERHFNYPRRRNQRSFT